MRPCIKNWRGDISSLEWHLEFTNSALSVHACALMLSVISHVLSKINMATLDSALSTQPCCCSSPKQIIQGYVYGTVLLSKWCAHICVICKCYLLFMLSTLSTMETPIKLVCNILTLTEKQLKPQVCYPPEELDCTSFTVFPYFSLKSLIQMKYSMCYL